MLTSLKEKEALIRKTNCLYHDAEYSEYDDRHNEIIAGEVDWWDGIGKRYLQNKNSFSLLDMGTGTGFVLRTLTKYLNEGNKVVAYDLSQLMLRQAKKNLDSIATNEHSFVCGDAENLPFPDDFFDIITTNAVLHHLPNYKRCNK